MSRSWQAIPEDVGVAVEAIDIVTRDVIDVKVVDVKTERIESAARIHRALDIFPADKLIINPDCGLRHLPSHVTSCHGIEAGGDGRRNCGGPPSPAPSLWARSPNSDLAGTVRRARSVTR
ncbi:MAG: hypothetical protein JO364_04295 [Pseudonocardiales bacterium]|nr:hypothetical protein [Pseudonocardiales bacterium]